MHADIVVDLGFGDAGKGLITDALVRKNHAGLVVRYNGGAQAGHHVVTPDGRQHTFAQFGAGSFVAGTRTFLSRYMVIHPTALLLEGQALESKGVADIFKRIKISESCPVITPYHQAANRIREMARGNQRFGTCGVGVGEVVEDERHQCEDAIRAGDLTAPIILKEKLHSIRNRKRLELLSEYGEKQLERALTSDWQFFEWDDLEDEWIKAVEPFQQMGLVSPDSVLADWCRQTEYAVFEGAQGMLLDAEAGFSPYNSWTHCSAENAIRLLDESAPGAETNVIGVTRSYMVRHGPGPLPTETGELIDLIAENNRRNEWQGNVRYGWWDAVLLRYAMREAAGIDHLAVTHMDVLPKLKRWTFSDAYETEAGKDEFFVRCGSRDDVCKLGSLHGLPLPRIEAITQMLMQEKPVLHSTESDEQTVLSLIEDKLQKPAKILSRGDTCGEVLFL